jgi:hypothetical protein
VPAFTICTHMNINVCVHHYQLWNWDNIAAFLLCELNGLSRNACLLHYLSSLDAMAIHDLQPFTISHTDYLLLNGVAWSWTDMLWLKFALNICSRYQLQKPKTQSTHIHNFRDWCCHLYSSWWFLHPFIWSRVWGLSKKYLTLGRENKVLYLGDYNT